jgi:hypothetical protein
LAELFFTNLKETLMMKFFAPTTLVAAIALALATPNVSNACSRGYGYGHGHGYGCRGWHGYGCCCRVLQ